MIGSVAIVLLQIVGGLLALLFLIMCMPIRLSGSIANLNISELDGVNLADLVWRAEIGVLFGLVKLHVNHDLGSPAEALQIRLFGYTKVLKPIRRSSTKKPKASTSSKGKTESPQQKTQSKRLKSSQSIKIGPGQIRRLLTEGRGLIKNLWRALHLDGRGHITYGFPDPFLTGLAHGVLLRVKRPKNLVLQADYLQGTLRGWADLRLTIYPIQHVWIIVRTACRPAVRTLWWPHLRAALPWSKAS